MSSYAEPIDKQALDQDMINDLREWAVADAWETFTQEQLAHWYYDTEVNDPPAPQQLWLEDWLLGRRPNEAEWAVYEMHYKNALRRALHKLDSLWERYEKAMESANEMASECFTAMEEMASECLTAMEGK